MSVLVSYVCVKVKGETITCVVRKGFSGIRVKLLF